MGNRVSSAVGCLISNRGKHGNSALGIHSNCDPLPPDEGLGHSFYYVRPATFGSDSSTTTVEFSFESGSGIMEADGAPPAPAAAAIGSGAAAAVVQEGGSFRRGEVGPEQHKRSTRVSWERVPTSTTKRAPAGSSSESRPKSMSETSFKVISGASVSANTATPRSITSQEQFNSFSNILFDRASAFESTSSFNALPLQPVPRGSIPNSGPLSGPLSAVPISGPISLERGFLSGPLERGFMSGPMERGVMSGPLEAAYAGHFSAPLAAELYPGNKFRRKTAAWAKYMRTLSRKLQKAVMRKMATALEKTHQSLFVPMKLFLMRDSKEEDGERDIIVVKQSIELAPDIQALDYASSDPDTKEHDANLQWAQGKAGEDRVHVVLSEEHGWLFVGIYDGFNGPDAPDFLMSNLYPAIYRELKGLLWDREEDGFDHFQSAEGSPEEKEAAAVFPSNVVESDVEAGDDLICWRHRSCGNSFHQQLDSKPSSKDHCHVWQSSESGNGVINHVDHPIKAPELVNGDRKRGCKENNMGFFNIPCSIEEPVQTVNGAAAAAAALNPFAQIKHLTTNHSVMENGDIFDVGCVQANGNLDACQALCSWLRKTVDDEDAHNLPRENNNCDLHHALRGNCHSYVKKPDCRIAVEMCKDSEGILGNEGTLEEKNMEAKHGPQLDLNGCRASEERILQTLSRINLSRINSEHTTDQQPQHCGTFEKPPLERLEQQQQKKMRIRGSDIEDLKSVRRPKDLLALQRLQDDQCTQQQQGSELLQWRYNDPEEQQQLREKLELKQEAQGNGRNSVDHVAVLEALEHALKATEAAFLEMADRVLHENPELMVMGSCVLVMLMKDEDVYIMNVGDSRAVVAQERFSKRGSLSYVGHAQQPNGLTVEEPPEKTDCVQDTLVRSELDKIIEETPTESKGILKLKTDSRSLASPAPPGSFLLDALQLSSDHSTSILEEVLRVKAEHPNDENAISNNRVKGQLKVTRAFGAGFLKQPAWNNALLKMFRCDFEGTDPYITCNPFLHHHRLGPQDHFLVLSSDGLYQYLSNEEVVSRVEWFMQNFPDGDPAQHLIEELLFRAAKKNGMDFHELLDIPQGDRRKYHDDVYVMVISLEGRIWKSSG